MSQHSVAKDLAKCGIPHSTFARSKPLKCPTFGPSRARLPHGIFEWPYAAFLFLSAAQASRHERTAFLVIDEAAARRRVAKVQQQTGRLAPIREADVLAKVAGEMSQQPVKASSLAFLVGSSDIRRGGLSHFQRSMEVAERIQGQPGVTMSAYHEARL